jgi:dTDP-4-amino-4,6-dideoxygalactose transaminase
MTEMTAAIAITQLNRADEIIENRINQANALTSVASNFPWITSPKVREGCKHVYYTWAFKFDHQELGISRESFIRAMEAEGFPLVNGYVAPLYRLPAFSKYARSCPISERMHDTDLGYFENCGWSLTPEQIQQFGEALKKIEDNVGILRKAA